MMSIEKLECGDLIQWVPSGEVYLLVNSERYKHEQELDLVLLSTNTMEHKNLKLHLMAYPCDLMSERDNIRYLGNITSILEDVCEIILEERNAT